MFDRHHSVPLLAQNVKDILHIQERILGYLHVSNYEIIPTELLARLIGIYSKTAARFSTLISPYYITQHQKNSFIMLKTLTGLLALSTLGVTQDSSFTSPQAQSPS